MKNFTKLLVATGCISLALGMQGAYAVEDFSFDLDSAINNVDKNTDEAKANTPSADIPKSIYDSVDAKSYLTESDYLYYHDALVKSLIKKYREKNYVGCIQEAQSKIKMESPNPVAMYYMALAYTQIGDVNAALELYEAILRLNPSDTLAECVVRGRDCLTGGSSCPNIGVEGADVDSAVDEYQSQSILLNVNTHTGGASPITESDKNIISAESPLPEISEENNLVKKNSNEEITATPSNEEVLQAIKTLQSAGISVTLQPGQTQMTTAINPELAQLQMLTGNSGQPNNSFDMLPYMLMQSQNNPQYNPQMVQAMMMNYMMPNFNSDKND